jgi:hypothetical protein
MRREGQQEDMHKIQVKLDEVRACRKRLLEAFDESIRNKRVNEEEADVLRQSLQTSASSFFPLRQSPSCRAKRSEVETSAVFQTLISRLDTV